MVDPYELVMAFHRAENGRASSEDWCLIATVGVRRTVNLEIGTIYESHSDSRKRIDLQASARRNSSSAVLQNR